MNLDEGHYYIHFFAITYVESKFAALEKPGKLEELISPTSWPPCDSYWCGDCAVCRTVGGRRVSSRWSERSHHSTTRLLPQRSVRPSAQLNSAAHRLSLDTRVSSFCFCSMKPVGGVARW